jgi:HEAT repeat protein
MSASIKRRFAFIFGVLALSAACFASSSDSAKNVSTAVNGSGKDQLKAIDELGARHENGSSVVPELRKLLSSGDAQVRWRSARALGEYRELARDTASDLVKLLRDENPVVQYHSAIALGKIEDKSDATVSALVDSATSKDPLVARAAIKALRHLKPGPERVAAALKQALKSNDQAVTVHALESIVEQGGKATPLLKETLKEPETAYVACAAVEQIGPAAAGAVPELKELLGKTKHSQLLIQTLLALASIGPAAESAEDAIAPLLETKTDDTVPIAAAYALGAIGAKDSDAALNKAIAKDDPFLHMVAAWALAKRHRDDEQLMKQAVDALTKGLANKDAKMRTAAAKGLQMLQPPAELVAPALMAAANDPDPDVSANVVDALAGLGESIVPRATKALQNPKARELTLRVLTKLGPKAAGAVPALIEVSKDASPELRAKIFLTLAAIGPAAAPAASALADGLGSDNKAVRESALYALREIGPEARVATRRLVRKMEADQSFESLAAAWALARIAGDDTATAARIIPTLKRGLSNADEQTRLNSVEAMGGLGRAATDSEKELKNLSRDDSSPAVRAAATAAAKRIARSS